MKTIIKRMNPKLVKWFLPWIATVITALPYSDIRSMFLDRLISLSEGRYERNII